MGAKTWMLAYVDGNAAEILKSRPALDRAAAAALAKELFPSAQLEPIEDKDLSWTCPRGGEVYIGCFPGVSIIAAEAFALDHPSKLPARFLEAARGRTVYLHAMHSVVDWFAFAVWKNGTLQRSLSVAPDNGIIEDIGPRLPFEEPYWAGQHPLFEPGEEDDDDEGYPFPFHPLDLGEAALLEFFGFQLEGMMDASHLEPEDIPLAGFKRGKPWWKVW